MINIKINMMIKIMMVALMFSHPCWPQPYETRTVSTGTCSMQVTIGRHFLLRLSASCSIRFAAFNVVIIVTLL